MLTLILAAGAVLCAIQAVRARQLLASALWLAGVSALLSIVFYIMGAQQIAVIELSVGAGLITVLFVFAISVAGDDAISARPIIPRPLAAVMSLGALGLLGAMLIPAGGTAESGSTATFVQVFWQDRSLDLLIQMLLIFAGVIGVLGLLTGSSRPAKSVESALDEDFVDALSTEYRAVDRAGIARGGVLWPAGQPQPDQDRDRVADPR